MAHHDKESRQRGGGVQQLNSNFGSNQSSQMNINYNVAQNNSNDNRIRQQFQQYQNQNQEMGGSQNSRSSQADENFYDDFEEVKCNRCGLSDIKALMRYHSCAQSTQIYQCPECEAYLPTEREQEEHISAHEIQRMLEQEEQSHNHPNQLRAPNRNVQNQQNQQQRIIIRSGNQRQVIEGPQGQILIQSRSNNQNNAQYMQVSQLLNLITNDALLFQHIVNFGQLKQAQLDNKRYDNPLEKNIIEQLPSHKYKKSGKEERKGEDSSKCMICQMDYEQNDEILTLTCFHLFHKDCVKNWFETQNFCPICRTKISLQ